jgi:hypothetical protein
MKFQAGLTIKVRDLQLGWKCLVGAWGLLRVLHSVQMDKVLLFFVISKPMEERITLRRCVLVVTLSKFCQIIFGYSIYLLITLKSFKSGSMDPLATLSCRFILPIQE